MRSVPSELIKTLARRVGFDLCGICLPDVIPEARARYLDWLERGYHGNMTFLAKDTRRRTEPRRILPEVRSIIMLGLNYYHPDSPSVPPGHGRVSKYARGRDYHLVAKEMMSRLEELIRSSGDDTFGAQMESFVDSSPLLERTWAARAGLGYFGKNCLLINRDFGSWIFLAGILTDLEIEPDNPHAVDHGDCVNCRRCIEAGPTSAIVADGVLDARRCIAYLTIEHPGEVANELAEQMDEWMYGCDICQDVCPHNRRAIVTTNPDFHDSHGVGECIDALRVIGMTSREDFRHLAAGTSLSRTGLDGLKHSARRVLDYWDRSVNPAG
jgi:epoxyqueuosine reductase